MYNKIQPEQIEIHTFSSPTGNIVFGQGSDYVYADLNNNLIGEFNIDGSLTINNTNLFITDSSNSYTLNNNVILGGTSNSIIFGTGNAIINSFNSAVNGKNNLDLHSDTSIFDPTSNSCTILAGKNNLIELNVSGSAIISDFTSTSTSANENNKFYISFQNGTDFVGNVGINDDLILNNGSRLLLHPNASAIFSGEVVIDNSFTFRDGSSVNGSSSYPTDPTDAGDKGRFAYFDNNFFIKNNGRWIKFFGSTGDWGNFNLNSGSLKLKTIGQFGQPTTGDLISWSNGTLNQSIFGNTEITSFPSFGGSGSLIVPDTGGTLKTLTWQNGLIVSTGLFDYLGLAANGKSGSFNISTTTGVKSITWKDGQITSTGDSSFSIGSDVLVYLSGTQQISGLKEFSNGVILGKTTNQLQFKTGQAGFVGSITMPTIGDNRTYTIPDVSSDASFVLTSGAQTIGGVKTFTSTPNVNGVDVLLVGQGGGGIPSDIVYTTGNQSISGNKTFSNGFSANGGITGTNLIYNSGNQPIDGIKSFSLRPTVNGSGVLLSGEKNVVYVTGNQEITGTKSFATGVILQAHTNQIHFKTGSAGNVMFINVPSIATDNRTYTIPDVGVNAAFVLNSGGQNIGGIKTFQTGVIVQAGGNQLELKTGSAGGVMSITAPTIGANRTYTIPDVSSDASFVLTSGAQFIGGQKTFTTRPMVGATGVLLQGEGGGLIPSDIAYATGNQLISGIKTFQTGIIIRAGVNQLNFKTGDAGFTGSITMPSISGNRTYAIPDLPFATADFVMNTGDQFIGGLKKFTTRPTVNGSGVLLVGEAQSSVLPTTLVYIDDTQIITAAKTFNGGLISPVGITGANLIYNTGNQQITGIKTFQDGVILQAANNQLKFKAGPSSNTINITAPTITADATYTIPNIGGPAAFVLNSGTQNIGGVKTFTDRAVFNAGISSNVVTGGNLVYNTGDQTIDGVKQFKELSIVNTAGDARLEIGGTLNVYIDLKNPNTDDYDFRIATDTADAVLTTRSGSLNFNVSGINRLHLNKDGKIGIGTTTPTSTLDVRGLISNYVGTTGTPTILQNWGYNNEIARWKPVIESDASLAFYGYDTAGGSAAQRLVISNSNGNVGINKYVPETKLHIETTGNSAIEGLLVRNTLELIDRNAVIAVHTSGANGGDPLISWDINGVQGWSAGIDNSDDDKFKISRNYADLASATKVTIDGDAVGVGTTSPLARLHLKGSNNSWMDGLLLEQGSTPQKYAISAREGNKFSISDETNLVERFVILSGGNVGMGTDAPATKLEVAGEITSKVSTQTSNIRMANTDWGAFFRNDNSNFYLLSTAQNDIYGSWNSNRPFSYNFSNGKVEINSLTALLNGNVGIGISNPVEKLAVKGNLANYNGVVNSQTSLTQWGWDNGAVRWATVLESNASLSFNSVSADGLTANTRLTIGNSNGNVGIGTTAPNSKLHVVGNSYINGGLMGDTLAAISSTTSHSQGAYLEWNKGVGDGQTYLLNQKGSGPGGIVFGDVTVANAITTGIFLNSSNVAQFYNRPTVNGTGVMLSGDAAVAPTNLLTNLGSTSGIYSLGQSAYDALAKLPNVLYIITGA